MKLNILIVGVGGQGALTTAHLIARSAMKAGLNVITAETHGMAQRGGSVEVHVRLGEVFSPLIPDGSADIVLALEPVEALRYARFIGKNTVVILNNRKIVPPSVTAGLGKYPELEEIVEKLRKVAKKVFVVPATDLAMKVGEVVVTNVVIVGILLSLMKMPFKLEHAEEAIKEMMRDSEINLRALRIGYDFRSIQPSAV
ncbi:MAG: indolepyruvate oxidoreductase subunit beta [Archaeoglobaceae archaeon]